MLTFSLFHFSVSAPLKPLPAPVCECGAHLSCSRLRLGMLNDPERNEKYVNYLKQVLKQGDQQEDKQENRQEDKQENKQEDKQED